MRADQRPIEIHDPLQEKQREMMKQRCALSIIVFLLIR